MDKELLFEFLKTKFLEAGFSEDECKLQISRLDKRYSTLSEDEIEADVRTRGGASHFAEAIILRRNTVLLRDPEYLRFAQNSGSHIPPLYDKAEQEAYMSQTKGMDGADTTDTLIQWFSSDTPVSESEALPASRTASVKRAVRTPVSAEPKAATASPALAAQSHPAIKKISTPQKNTDTPAVINGAQHTSAAPKIAENASAPKANTSEKQENGHTRVIDMPAKRSPLTTPVFSAERVQDDRSGEKKNIRREKAVPSPHKTAKKPLDIPAKKKARQPKTTLADMTYWGEGTEEGYRRFRICFWVSLPFVIVLLAVIAVLFLGVAALLAAAIAALVLLLVAEVAVGSAITVVGIIYGASQLFTSLPIGLFELGIAVTVLGATMLLGILIYNLAVRFLPFVLKKFFAFIRFFIAFLQDLYYYVKGECYRR